MPDKKETPSDNQLDRRVFLAASTGLAAIAAGCASETGDSKQPLTAKKASGDIPQAPFDSIRDYMQALDAHGLVMRIPEIDQDEYEATGLVFRMSDTYGMYGAPAYLFDRVKIDGEWVEGPVMGNVQGHWTTDNIALGVPWEPLNHYDNYKAAKAAMKEQRHARHDPGRQPAGLCRIAPGTERLGRRSA